MLARLIWPVSRTIRTGTKLRIVPTTAVIGAPSHQCMMSMIGAPYPSIEETAIRSASAAGSTWRSGVAGSIHWLFCSKPLNMYGSPTKPPCISS